MTGEASYDYPLGEPALMLDQVTAVYALGEPEWAGSAIPGIPMKAHWQGSRGSYFRKLFAPAHGLFCVGR